MRGEANINAISASTFQCIYYYAPQKQEGSGKNLTNQTAKEQAERQLKGKGKRSLKSSPRTWIKIAKGILRPSIQACATNGERQVCALGRRARHTSGAGEDTLLVANATFYTNADKRKNCRKGRARRQAPTRRSKTITPLRHAYAKICAGTSPKAGYATPCAMHTQEYPPKRRRTIFRCACYAKGTTANAALGQA